MFGKAIFCAMTERRARVFNSDNPPCYIMEQPAIDTTLAAFMEAQALLDQLSCLLETQMGNKASSLIYDIQLLLTRIPGKTYLTYKSGYLTIERNNAYVDIFLDNEKEDPIQIVWGIHNRKDIIQYHRSGYGDSRYCPPSGCFHGRLDPREPRRTVNMYNLESKKSSPDIEFTTELFQQDFSSVRNDEGYQGLFLADLPIGYTMPALPNVSISPVGLQLMSRIRDWINWIASRRLAIDWEVDHLEGERRLECRIRSYIVPANP